MDNKQQQLERLVKIADLMETFADDPQTLKELSKEYKQIVKSLPKSKEEKKYKYTSKQIKDSREEALKVIEDILDKGDVNEQFKDRGRDYYSKDKFIVSWKVNHNDFPYEVSIDLTDSFYSEYSGAKCIKARRSLFSEQQLEAYGNIEYGLIKEGLKLCSGRDKKEQFFNKYAKPYNEKIKNGTI